jgi:uncharacterized protein
MDTDRLRDRIEFHGHENVLANHYNTIEITTEAEISTRADCIIGVNGSKACSQLNPALKRHIQNSGQLSFELIVNDFSFVFNGSGSPKLDLCDSREIVLRKSWFVSSRTVALGCNKAACDIPRDMIRMLQDRKQKGYLDVRGI